MYHFFGHQPVKGRAFLAVFTRNAGPFPAGILDIICVIIFWSAADKGPTLPGYIHEKRQPFSCLYFSHYIIIIFSASSR